MSWDVCVPTEFDQITFHLHTKEEPQGVEGLKTFQTKALKLLIFHIPFPKSSSLPITRSDLQAGIRHGCGELQTE